MKALIIPSAVLIPREMQKKFGQIPSVLYPLRDAPILDYILDQYRESADTIYVVVNRRRELVEDYVKLKKLPVRLVTLETLGDLGDTVRAGVEAALADDPHLDYLYLNFADTLLSDPVSELQGDTAYYAEEPFSEEWTYFEEAAGRITQILDKEHGERREDGSLHRLFVGSFGVADPRALLGSFQAIKFAPEQDSFYAALAHYSESHPVAFRKARGWLDAGHSENYQRAKTGVAARSFNAIAIDEARGILTKTSKNREKLCDEIRWYIRMPNRLQYLLPRIYDYSLDAQSPSVSMEYYGYSTLHELLLYGDLSLLKWRMIFDKILFAVTDMENYSVTDSIGRMGDALRAIYVDKTVDRLGRMRNNPSFAPFFEREIEVNGKRYPSLERILQLLPDLLEQRVVRSFDGAFHIIHGDLCFSNILIEDNYGFIRLIDPRGQFGGFDIYGDQRYEIAKLLHTLEGRYDFIIEDMFSLEVDGTCIRYRAPEKSEPILAVFRDVFADKLTDEPAVRLIEATLFLSMLPLHADSLQRQYAMLATGLTLLGEVTA